MKTAASVAATKAAY